MSTLLNLTPYAALCLPSMTRDDRELTLLVVQGRFAMPSAGVPARQPLRALDDQGDVLVEDDYYGDPATSSLRVEGQNAYTRPGTDIYLRGHACFGPIARHWQSRRTLAGTYDEAWLEHRIPLWPFDLDERFFSAASPGMLVVPHLQGGEPVRIVGTSPAGAFEFGLPLVVLQARFATMGSSIRRRLVLDAVDIDTDAEVVTMTWRASVAMSPLRLHSVVLRTLAVWELAS